jgi:hypothetical protein
VLGALLLAGVAVPALQLTAQSASDYVPDRQVLFPESQLSAKSALEYISPPVEAPHAFSHVLVRREATVPDGASLTLTVRASIDGTGWSDWATLEENDDLWAESDGPDVAWSQIVTVGALARFWQVRATWVPAPDSSAPALRQLDVNTLDALTGPEPVPDQLPESPETKSRSADLAGAVARPAVVSRTAWGSPDGQGSRAAPDYRAVTHMVVHHTADGNSLYPSEPFWAARVRAIWSYHAITRGWGDIGYNFLIDPNGVVYEGRAGGDNAVAFHDTGNYGSMGVAMLGTYQSQTPSQATQDALVQLLAWKASQRGIDPLGSSSYYGCLISNYCKPYHPDGVVPNISGHRQVTPGHTTCPGDATMAILPNLRQRVAGMIGAGGGQPSTSATITSVQYGRTTLAAGELLQVAVTVRNTGQSTISGQAPRVDLGTTDASNAYVYRQDECFDGDAAGSSPAYPKESERYRVVLGTTNWDAANPGRCLGATSNYPWRWGLNSDLAPGQEQTIVGYVQFATPGSYTVQAGLVQEYVAYNAQAVSPATITVTGEQAAPDSVQYDGGLQPQAQVYRLGQAPDSLLQRAGAPLSIPRGEYLGSFAWSGERIDWGDGGPLGQSDRFVVVQTRGFVAPSSGEYTFRTTSDDGSWLIVDGVVVVNNFGMHPAQESYGRVQLSAGAHAIGYVYFDSGGFATAGYDVQMPGASGFQLLPDTIASLPHYGDTIITYPAPLIAADDAGGAGVATVRWRVNGGEWQDQPGALVQFGKLQTGRYWFQYQALDAAGNSGPVHDLAFTVNPNATQGAGAARVYLPRVQR